MKSKSNISDKVANFETLQKNIGYKFKNIGYLKTAVSHTSFVNENKRLKLDSNERQEFLGDSVLSLVVSDYLFKSYYHLPEGQLTKLRASLVCEKTLSQFATEIDLGSFLLLGNGEAGAGGMKKPSILADAFEALIAAIYLDSGMSSARSFVLKFVKSYLSQEHSEEMFVDYKTILQEIVQKNPDEKLCYRLVEEFGPDHDKKFKIEVLLNNNVIGSGVSKTKKHAEQLAAKEALILMGIKDF